MAAHDSIPVGQRFGRLTVIGEQFRANKRTLVPCKCDCGTQYDARKFEMLLGKIVSCGCHRREVTITMSMKHGAARHGSITTEYQIWSGMKKRCNDPKCAAFKDYGGRGIKVCDRWLDFTNFLADMGYRPGKNYSLDRIDNNRGYEPDNCRWATILEQVNNRRNTATVTYLGRTQSITDLARELGVKYWSLRNRIINLGWPIEKAMTEPFELGRNQFSR